MQALVGTESLAISVWLFPLKVSTSIGRGIDLNLAMMNLVFLPCHIINILKVPINESLELSMAEFPAIGSPSSTDSSCHGRLVRVGGLFPVLGELFIAAAYSRFMGSYLRRDNYKSLRLR